MTHVPPGFLLLLALSVGACTTPSRSVDPIVLTTESVSDLDEVLRYFQRIKKLNNAELSREYEHVSQSFSHTKADLSRVQYALLLSLPNASFRDDAAALNLLKEWSKENKTTPSGLRIFGGLLASLLEEIREKDKRAEVLQKKLDALKSMEKNLMQRDKP